MEDLGSVKMRVGEVRQWLRPEEWRSKQAVRIIEGFSHVGALSKAFGLESERRP